MSESTIEPCPVARCRNKKEAANLICIPCSFKLPAEVRTQLWEANKRVKTAALHVDAALEKYGDGSKQHGVMVAAHDLAVSEYEEAADAAVASLGGAA